MQMYLFKCKECGAVFEKPFRMTDEKKNIVCPNGHRDVQRLYTVPNVIFKGPGFYVNDSKPKLNGKDNHRGGAC